MKSISIRAVLMLAVLSCIGSASDREEVLRLLLEIQPFHQLVYQELEPDEVRQIRERAKAAVPKLRPLIKVGSSVLDYPGLMACGFLTYGGFEEAKIPGLSVSGTKSYGYELHIGVPPGREGIGKTDFRIVVDETGVIRKVEDVDYRR